MNVNRGFFGTGLALAGLYLSVACTSTTTGNEGNLDFSYTADDQITNFNKPIAVGAKLELRIHETGTRREVEVTDASTDDLEVLEVETYSSNRVILVGKGEGSALVEVSAETPSGEVVSDSVNMLAAVPDILELRHSCTNGADEAKYFVDTDGVLISYDFKKSNGQDVIGYGYFPIEVTGDAQLTLNQTSTDQANFRFDIGSTPGAATIASTIDDTTLNLDVVTIADVDGIDSNPASDFQLMVGETEYYHFWPTVGGVRVCQSEAPLEAATTTSNVCNVRVGEPADPDSSDFLDITGWIAVEGLEFGNCQFSVTYPGANGGEGVTVAFTAEVGDFPDDDTNASTM